jgi:broad specificity phosphatase PhoE
MDLLWVRHAEPERVAPGGGAPANPGLTSRGREQAERIADWLGHEHVDCVLSSPQLRARETAVIIAARHGLEIEVCDGIVEYDVQSDHYIPMEELREKDPERIRAMLEGRWESFGGESVDVFRTRVAKALDEIIDAHPGQRVVAVCHGGVINAALATVLGIEQPLWFDPRYTSLSRMIASRTGARSVVTVNEHAHLEARRFPE